MLLAQFEQDLNRALEYGDGGNRFRDVFWTYYDPIAEVLDTVARAEGWPVLLDLIDAYDPRAQDAIPIGSAPLTNAVARSLIRTRLTQDVSAISADTLSYLSAIPRLDNEEAESTWEESMHYGWAIGHPDHLVANTIRDLVLVDVIWASAAAYRALYADQHAAVDPIRTVQHPVHHLRIVHLREFPHQLTPLPQQLFLVPPRPLSPVPATRVLGSAAVHGVGVPLAHARHYPAPRRRV